MKRLISLVLTFALVIGCCPMAAFAENEESEIPAEPDEYSEMPDEYVETPMLLSEDIEQEPEPYATEDELLTAALNAIESRTCTLDDIRYAMSHSGKWPEGSSDSVRDGIKAAFSRFLTTLQGLIQQDYEYWEEAEAQLAEIKSIADGHPDIQPNNYAEITGQIEYDIMYAHTALLHEHFLNSSVLDYLTAADASYAVYQELLTHLTDADKDALTLPEPSFDDYYYRFQRNTEELVLHPQHGSGPNLPFTSNNSKSFTVTFNGTEYHPLFLFQKTETTSGWLNGFTRFDNAADLQEGTAYLAALVLEKESGSSQYILYLLTPNAPSTYVPLMEVDYTPPVPQEQEAEIPGLGQEITVEWDNTLAFTEEHVLIAPNDSVPVNGLYTLNIPAEGNAVYASAQFAIPAAGTGADFNTIVPLDNCVFTVETNSETYRLSSGEKKLSLGDSVFGETSSISITKLSSYHYTLSAGSNYLAYSSTGLTVANTASSFYLFKQNGDIYYPIDTDTVANGNYLIACSTGSNSQWMLLYPGDSSNTAVFKDYSKGAWRNASMYPHSTQMTFTGLKPTPEEGIGTLPVSNAEESSSYYNVKVTIPSYYLPESLAKMNDSVVTDGADLYTVVGGDVRAVFKGSYNSPSDLVFEGDAKQTVSASIINSYGENQLYGNRWGGGDYTGTEVPINNYLYTFTQNGDRWKISATTEDGKQVYLRANHGIIHSTNPEETFQIEENSGYFTFYGKNTAAGTPRALFFWRWKMISNDYEIMSNPSYLKTGTTRFRLYQKASGAGCQELPGFVRVNSIQDGGQYLIAVIYKDEVKLKSNPCMYILRPTLENNNNAPLVERSLRHTSSSTEFAFKGLKEGTAVVNTGNGANDVSINIHVLNRDAAVDGNFYSKTGSAANNPVNNITISSGMEYGLVLHDIDPTHITWFSGNNQYATVDQNGVITTMDANFLDNQEIRWVDIYAYVSETAKLYKKTLTIIKNSYGSESYQTNVIDHYIHQLVDTELYLGIPMYRSYDIQFQQVNEHDVTYLYRSNEKPWGLNYFTKPKEGYVMTYLFAGNSSGDFYRLDSNDASQTAYYRSGVIGTQKTIYTVDGYSGDTIMKNVIQTALDMGCTNAFGFSQHIGGGQKLGCDLKCIATKLPEVTKKAAYLLKSDGSDSSADQKLQAFRDDYKDGGIIFSSWETYKYNPASAQVGANDIVVFEIAVEQVPDSDQITFTRMTLKETDGFPLLNNSLQLDSLQLDITNQINVARSGAGRIVFYAYHVITQGELGQYQQGTEIVNTVTLECAFTTPHQSGTKIGSATARAAVEFSISNYISFVNLSLDTGITANFYLNHSYVPQKWVDGTYYVVMSVGSTVVKQKLAAGESWTLKKKGETSKTDGTGEAGDTTESKTLSKYSIAVPLHLLDENILVHIENASGAKLTDDYSAFSVLKYNNVIQNNEASIYQSWQKEGGTKFAYTNYANLKALMSAMMDLGYYTKAWLNAENQDPTSQTNWPVSNALQLPSLSSLASNALPGKPEEKDGIEFVGMNLEIGKSNVGMRVYFKSTPALNMEQVASTIKHVDLLNGTYYQLTEAGEIKQAEEAKNLYYVVIPNVTSKLLDNSYTVTIVRKNKDGSFTSPGARFTFSALTYVYLMAKEIEKGSTAYSAELQNMTAALYNYNQAATAYFGDNKYTST